MKNKRFLTLCAGVLASACLMTACSNSSTNSTTDSSAISQTDSKQTLSLSSLSSGEVTTTLDLVDNSQWLYNAEDNVYYQTGISYAATPVDSEQQTLSIFVPGDYMTATDNGDGTYTATINADASVGQYTASTAPVVIPINTPGYSAMVALTDYTSAAKDYTDAGMIYVSAGLRGRDSGAPGGVTDAKAAIRYIRYNAGNIAGDTDTVFVFGMSGGGAQSAILGASGDSALYDDYLTAIGAVTGVSDAVSGVMAWSPITNLDSANAAYEWNMGVTRTDLDSETQALSDGLAQAFADYINQLGITDENGNVLSLETSDEGIYQAGSYYDYIKATIEDSLNTFLANTDFPYDGSSASAGGGMGGRPEGGLPSGQAPDGAGFSMVESDSETVAIEDIDDIQRTTTDATSLDLSGTYETAADYIAALNANGEWVSYDESTNTVTITSVADFVKNLKSASKNVGAFDDLDRAQGENQLFGFDGQSLHWDSTMASLLEGTDYAEDFAQDLTLTDSLGKDTQTRILMYTPLYYLLESYGGTNTSQVASNWRIRSGINQGDTALSTEVNLALALKQYGISNVDFATVWGQGHTEAEITGDSTSNFIAWVQEVTAN